MLGICQRVSRVLGILFPCFFWGDSQVLRNARAHPSPATHMDTAITRMIITPRYLEGIGLSNKPRGASIAEKGGKTLKLEQSENSEIPKFSSVLWKALACCSFVS